MRLYGVQGTRETQGLVKFRGISGVTPSSQAMTWGDFVDGHPSEVWSESVPHLMAFRSKGHVDWLASRRCALRCVVITEEV